MEEKQCEFDDWNVVKKNLDSNGRQPNPKQGEIWWVGSGKNVGSEIDGKGSTFARPFLLYRKLSRYNFMGIPLTSQEHEGSWYVQFEQAGRIETAIIAQARCLSIKRLYSKLGQIDDDDLLRIKKAFLEFYDIRIGKNVPPSCEGGRSGDIPNMT